MSIETSIRYKCDRCNGTITVEYTLPRDWRELEERDQSTGVTTRTHLCPGCSNGFDVFMNALGS